MKYLVACFLAVAMTAVLTGREGRPVIDDGDALMEAYVLRLSGRADEAEAMLDSLLREDSTNAQLYFELARTKQHLYLGGREMSWDEVVQAGRQAAFFAPDNKTYAFYYAVNCLTDAYLSLMQQQQDALDKISRAGDAFQSVLAIDPDCYEAILYLVDLYGVLPAEMGGDSEKAEAFVAALEQKDKIYGAIARSKLLPESTDQVSYWEDVIRETGSGARTLEELGRAYLFRFDTENGSRYFQEAIQADPENRHLTMHLVRYHLIMSQQNPDQKQENLQKAMELAQGYLDTEPELTQPQKGHTCQIMALIKNLEGDPVSSDTYLEQAASFDPYYSRASGVPAEMLYCSPDEVKIRYSSFFLPF